MSTRRYNLKPCPFCGSKDVNVQNMGWPHHVYCLNCQAQTVSVKYAFEGEAEAVAKWNQRNCDRDCKAEIQCELDEEDE